MLASGFTNAPVSRAFLFGTIAFSILASITDSKYLFHIQVVPHLWPYKQLWRVLVWQLCYTNSTELLFAGMTIYHMRIIERLWGSSKFASFLATLFPLTTFLPPFLLSTVLRPLSLGHLNFLPAGPTAAIFALLAQYHAAIPRVYKYRVSTALPSSSSSSSTAPSSSSSSAASDSSFLLFSDKSLTYLIAGQLALSQLPGSGLAAAVGWGCGVAWRNYLLPVKVMEWRVPGWLVGGSHGRGRAGEGFEDLRRRLEGESRATGAEGSSTQAEAAAGPQQARGRRGWVGSWVDGIRGAL